MPTPTAGAIVGIGALITCVALGAMAIAFAFPRALQPQLQPA